MKPPTRPLWRRALRSPLLKRTVDIIGATIGLILLSPVMLVVAVMIRLQMGSPVLFRQKRGGLHHTAFELLKFRTMRDRYDEHGQPLPDSERITALGAFLRRTSLDELPGLFNVLRGDLSLVGPRPLLYRYIERYSPEQSRRHDVKPGITGWAQIHGRNAITWEQKFAHDLWYVAHWNVLLDLSILVKTIWLTLQSKDVNAEQDTTMPEFMGTSAIRPPSGVGAEGPSATFPHLLRMGEGSSSLSHAQAMREGSSSLSHAQQMGEGGRGGAVPPLRPGEGRSAAEL